MGCTVAPDGSVLQSAAPVGHGTALSLRWMNQQDVTVADQHVRVQSPACGSTCGPDDTYRLRFYETTLRGPRFNNAGGQVTVVLLQNASDQIIAGRLYLWGTSASGNVAVTIPPHGLVVFDTSQILPTFDGSITVAHDGAYGMLVGKAVSLQPSTGLGFDTPLTPRPR